MAEWTSGLAVLGYTPAQLFIATAARVALGHVSHPLPQVCVRGLEMVQHKTQVVAYIRVSPMD
jgi:hypothetical protein